MVSVSGIVVMILGIYLIVGYLDSQPAYLPDGASSIPKTTVSVPYS